jgi:P-type Cu2+ transporter
MDQTLKPQLKVVGGRDAPSVAAQAGPAAPPTPEPTPQNVTLIVENMRCGSCMVAVEKALQSSPGVTSARANLTAKRVTARYDAGTTDPDRLVTALARAGFTAAEATYTPDETAQAQASDLLRRLGVAGFAAANVMLLSVSVWAGLASDMDKSAASLFHWLSALIALPAIVYAGQPFFGSALGALKAARLNMDVPISLGIVLASGMSLFQTIRGGDQVYFDAAIMLTFFLLIGRFLDESVRIRAKGAAENLLGLKALSATVIDDDRRPRRLQARALQPGMRVLVAAGERIPVDGRVVSGTSEIEESLITGETLPRLVRAEATVHAGTVNLTTPIEVAATATDEGTLIAEIARLMQAAEQGRGRYVRLADRAAGIYAPAVHILGAATFIGWMLAGAGWEQALTYGIAVLIITCPCALALAVPAVQVAATGRLFARGVIVKAPDALERLAECDTVVLDKTGTLTLGEPRLVDSGAIDPLIMQHAASLAAHSRHPYSRAIVKAAAERGIGPGWREQVREVAGSGLVAEGQHGEERLGAPAWVGADDGTDATATLWYRNGSAPPVPFHFEDALRPDAVSVIADLRDAGYHVEILSGDRESAVAAAAKAAGIDTWHAGVRPDGKIARLEALRAQGRKVAMVGDGLNDAPALAAGHASLSPSSAADISQTAADAIFQGERLAPILDTISVARKTRGMSLQNFAIALGYNAFFVPLAVAGFVTPLIAALAMSASSIAVTGNAMRLRTMRLAQLPPPLQERKP